MIIVIIIIQGLSILRYERSRHGPGAIWASDGYGGNQWDFFHDFPGGDDHDYNDDDEDDVGDDGDVNVTILVAVVIPAQRDQVGSEVWTNAALQKRPEQVSGIFLSKK